MTNRDTLNLSRRLFAERTAALTNWRLAGGACPSEDDERAASWGPRYWHPVGPVKGQQWNHSVKVAGRDRV